MWWPLSRLPSKAASPLAILSLSSIYSPFRFTASLHPAPPLALSFTSYHLHTFNPESSNDDEPLFIGQGRYRSLFPILRVKYYPIFFQMP